MKWYDEQIKDVTILYWDAVLGQNVFLWLSRAPRFDEQT